MRGGVREEEFEASRVRCKRGGVREEEASRVRCNEGWSKGGGIRSVEGTV